MEAGNSGKCCCGHMNKSMTHYKVQKQLQVISYIARSRISFYECFNC
jgi:hypothetical protein